MRFRKLRIAWSVAWGLACVLLIVLWVRSYWYQDIIAKGWGTMPNQCVSLWSQSGAFELHYWDGRRNTSLTFVRWKVTTLYSAEPGKLFPVGGLDDGFAGFLFQRLTDGFVVSLPCWFLVPVCITFGSLPWLPWTWRFRLRTLLIATTLVAVVLGTIAWLR